MPGEEKLVVPAEAGHAEAWGRGLWSRVGRAARGVGSRRRVRRAMLGFLIFALAWELVGRFVVTGGYAFAPLSAVLAEAAGQFRSGQIYVHVQASFLELLLGFGAASILGILLGILVGVSDRVSDCFLPLSYALNATPVVALAPLIIVVMGIGVLSKVVVIFLLCYFPILINTAAGMRNVDDGLVEAAIAFGASRQQLVRKVLLPNAVAFVVAGMRVAIGRGFVGVIVAELYGASAGLGWLSWYASEQMNATLLFVAVLILALAGVATTFALDVLERKVAPWR